MLETGSEAPGFSLPSTDMEMISLDGFRGRIVVLYFYPRDDTPGCTVEATEFSELLEDFGQAGAVVLGVSRDNCFSHQAFRDKFGLTVTLLADTEGEVCGDYGVWQERERNGRKRMGIVRSTFVIDRDGIIRRAEYGVTAKGHAQQILEFVKTL